MSLFSKCQRSLFIKGFSPLERSPFIFETLRRAGEPSGNLKNLIGSRDFDTLEKLPASLATLWSSELSAAGNPFGCFHSVSSIFIPFLVPSSSFCTPESGDSIQVLEESIQGESIPSRDHGNWTYIIQIVASIASSIDFTHFDLWSSIGEKSPGSLAQNRLLMQTVRLM